MQAVNGASQHMEKGIHLSEALGTTQPFLRYFFFLGHFYFQKLDGMTPVKENIPKCFGDQEGTWPAVNGYRTAFVPTKKYLGFTRIGIVLNTGSFYLDG